jgi:hypothetical protein
MVGKATTYVKDDIVYKICTKCGKEFDLSYFTPTTDGSQYGRQAHCRKCNAKRALEYNHKHKICLPMNENKKCSSYLGVFIAERILSKYFNGIKRAENNTSGYDFICKNGYKIDVKSSCLYNRKSTNDIRYPRWDFCIKSNKIADYFLLIAFDNRKYLNPLHLWLVPGEYINNKGTITLQNCKVTLDKWSKFEKSLDKVMECCNMLRGVD